MLQRLREDPDAEADAVSYASAIMACERGGRCEEALTLFDDMKRASLEPTAYIYMVCCPAEASKHAMWLTAGSIVTLILTLSQILTHRSLALTQPLIFTPPDPAQMLIDASEKAGQWSRAADVVRSMRDADVQSEVLAHRIMYAPLVQALLPAPLLKAARATVATGRAARRWITSN